jgi:hypothetical protein
VKSKLGAVGPSMAPTALDGSRRTRNVRTIGYGIRCLGWRQVQTKYCQIVDRINRLKRFIYCCFYKSYQEDFFDTIDVDETSVEIKFSSYSNYRKPGLLRPAGGKIGKPRHNFKVHLFREPLRVHRGPSGAVKGRRGAVGAIPVPSGAVKGRRGPSGADSPKVTFHRAVLYLKRFILLLFFQNS